MAANYLNTVFLHLSWTKETKTKGGGGEEEEKQTIV